MWLRLAALAAFVASPCVHAQGSSREVLALDDALARVARAHPELRLMDASRPRLQAELAQARLRPPLSAGVEIENALGTGEARGFDRAEVTLTLAGVLERGGKLDARRALAQQRIDALAIERETRRLDLLAETARRYLAVVAAHQQLAIARQEIAQRRRTVAAARQRLQAGASPQSVLLIAEAALARAELDEARGTQRQQTARQHLAAMWGERAPAFEVAATDATVLPDIDTLSALDALLAASPELMRFADERRIREARLQLARSATSADLAWQVGVRRLQEEDDLALVGSVSFALGASRRAQPEIRAAEAELASLEIEREASGLSLYATLVDAHGRYRVARIEVQRLRDDVLPRIASAEAAAERAYRAGATSYLEWAQLQSERTLAHRQQLDAALDAQRALIEIQRLTGQPFLAAPATSSKGNTP